MERGAGEWHAEQRHDHVRSPPPLPSSLTDPITDCRGNAVLTGKNPSLWWPVGYGNQALYNLTLSVLPAAAGKKAAALVAVSKRIGFRTLVLNQLPISPAEVRSPSPPPPPLPIPSPLYERR